MTIIKIIPYDNGGHDNLTAENVIPEDSFVPDGWAILPEDVGTPETLQNYPFGEITVTDMDGIPTVTSWTPLPVPEPEPIPEPPMSLEDRVQSLEAENAAISAAIERGMSL